MKHVYALLIKFLMVTIILEILLSTLTDLTLTEILYVSATVTVLAYVLGDLLILPASNNTVATLADVGLAIAVIYLFNYVWILRYINWTATIISAAAIGLGEWFFHKYVAKNVFPDLRTNKL